ncbi:hypothetical protein K474DRAFT_1185129 [Panus rudis PR-1116 ss-1]|nr:hypothetical protein K474DRAFT_1185129 [Panus rudis PR-1116 ss-1]
MDQRHPRRVTRALTNLGPSVALCLRKTTNQTPNTVLIILSPEEAETYLKGPFGDALRFFVDHVRGRSEVSNARNAIHALTDSKIPKPSTAESTIYDKVKRSTTRLNVAQQHVKGLQTKSQQMQQKILTAELEVASLEREVQNGRMRESLMSILEQKEAIRIRRIAELSRLLDDERKKITSESNANPAEGGPSPSPQTKLRIRAENTRDTIAMLQAYQIRLAELLRSDKGSSIPQIESRLLEAIARKMGLPVNDERVVAQYETCRTAARHRASLKLQYQPVVQDPPTRENVQKLADQVAEKRNKLQRTSDEIASLSSECTRLLQEISAFETSVVPELRESLEEDRKNTEGYLDKLRLSIDEFRYLRPFEGDQLLNTHGRTVGALVEDVRREIVQTYEINTFLESSLLPTPNAPDLRQKLDDFSKHTEEESDRQTKLLSRKAEKATKVGGVLVKDIEDLVKEVNSVGSLT